MVLGANVFDVWVQVPPPAPNYNPNFDKKFGLFCLLSFLLDSKYYMIIKRMLYAYREGDNMLKKFNFLDATSFITFINNNKDKIVGQKICRYYSDGFFGSFACGPVVFEFENFSVIIDYCFYSDIDIYVANKEMVINDNSLNFLYKDIPESRNLETWVHEDEEFPYIERTIVDIDISRFSSEFETNPSTGETRPEGGDYFSTITVYLDNNEEFYICAASPICDGGIDVWA